MSQEAVQTLVKLGLTVLQAKVYLALVRLGISNGRITAKQAQIASQDVYRVLGDLQEKGLVEKIISKPTMFKATTINDGLAFLLKNKKAEFTQLEKQIENISNTFNGNNEDALEAQSVQFVITSEINQLIKLHDKLAETTKHNLDIMIPTKANEKRVFEYYHYLKSVIRRGVKVRVLTFSEDHNDEQPSGLGNSRFELRFLPEPAIPFGMHIFDRHDATMAISQKPMPSLWTNNSHIVTLAEAYFENLWNNAQNV